MKAMVTLSSKGQFTLPAVMRARLGLKQGDRLEASFDEESGAVRLQAVPNLETLSARVSSYTAARSPVVDVDKYYQSNRER
jgi:AbrB family looped-hinge helix DNA binding protein